MKKYSQKELLQEGFWRGVGKTIGGVARGVDYVTGQVAPELQRLYKDPYKAAKGLVSAVRGTPSTAATKDVANKKNVSNVNPQETANIRKGLASKNINLLNTPTLSYTDPNTQVRYYNVEVESKGKKINAIVDANGNFQTP